MIFQPRSVASFTKQFPIALSKSSGRKMAADLYDADLSPQRRAKARETRGERRRARKTGISTRGANRRCSAGIRIESPFCFLYFLPPPLFSLYKRAEEENGVRIHERESTAGNGRPALIVNEKAFVSRKRTDGCEEEMGEEEEYRQWRMDSLESRETDTMKMDR